MAVNAIAELTFNAREWDKEEASHAATTLANLVDGIVKFLMFDEIAKAWISDVHTEEDYDYTTMTINEDVNGISGLTARIH